MTHTFNRRAVFSACLTGSLLILLAGGTAGCNANAAKPVKHEAGSVRAGGGGGGGVKATVVSRDIAPISLDGDISDWPSDLALAADDRYLYVRFTVDGEQFTLQGSPEPVSIMLDLDASTASGFVSSDPRLHQMGVDLQITFSPPGKNKGVEIAAIDSKGGKTPISWQDLDFSFAPTYASSWYELRLSRLPVGKGLALPKKGLFTQGPVEGVIALLNDDGSLAGASELMAFESPAVAAKPARSTLDLPTKSPGTLRVMSWNVEKSSPIKDPVRFRDVLTAVKPDVVLVQEWEEGDDKALKSWFDINCPANAGLVSDKPVSKAGVVVRDATGGWHVAKNPGNNTNGGGVAVVSRWPLEYIASPVTLASGKPIRFCPTIIKSPYGDVFAGSLHLKCCGTKGSPEDQQRMDEAKAINAFVSAHAGASTIRFFGGDFNLVGSRPPLDLVRAGLDVDGSDLTAANPETLGDRTFATWRGPGEFTPGRLDWIVYSDASTQIVGAWVLDSSRLGDEALALMNLKPDSTAASDHMPVIIDFKPGK